MMKPFLVAIDSGLNEAFEKLKRALDGLSEDELHWRPALESNTIDWMVWHMARVEDNWINVRLRNSESIWDRDGWAERCGVEVPDNGYGQSAEEIRAIPPFNVPVVMDYYTAVRQCTSGYFENEMQESDLTIELTASALRSDQLRVGAGAPAVRRGRASGADRVSEGDDAWDKQVIFRSEEDH